MFEESELVRLMLGVAFLVPLGLFYAMMPSRPVRLLCGAVLLTILAAAFTVAEEVVWPAGLNVLEHLCYALAGLLFAAGCWMLPGELPGEAEQP